MFPYPFSLQTCKYFFFLCREASSSSSHSSGSSASSSLPDSSRIAHRLHFASRTTRQHGGRWRWRWRVLVAAAHGALARGETRQFFEALFTFVRGGGLSSRALPVYAGQSIERVHLIHLINISETLNSQKMCTQNNALAWPISTPLRSLTLKRIPVTSRTFTSGSSLFRLPCRLNYFRWLAAVAGRPPERLRVRRRRRPEHHLQRRRRSSSAEAGMPRGPGGSFFPCCHAKGEPFAEPRRVACAAREIGAVSAG